VFPGVIVFSLRDRTAAAHIASFHLVSASPPFPNGIRVSDDQELMRR
jgi:hypothetical protein